MNMVTFEDQACRDRFIAGLVNETLQGKLNTNGHRNIVEFHTVVEIAKNYESYDKSCVSFFSTAGLWHSSSNREISHIAL